MGWPTLLAGRVDEDQAQWLRPLAQRSIIISSPCTRASSSFAGVNSSLDSPAKPGPIDAELAHLAT
jgi:hypothetical protein